MPAPSFRIYVAVSVDGFIATTDGGVDWLDAFHGGDSDYGYAEFVAGIATVVMGRATYDQVRGFGDWPYADKDAVVVSSRPADDLPDRTTVWADGIPSLHRKLADGAAGDVWVMGGGRTMRAFLDLGAVDRIDLFVMPAILGGGIPLFGASSRHHRLPAPEVEAYPDGIVRLSYAID